MCQPSRKDMGKGMSALLLLCHAARSFSRIPSVRPSTFLPPSRWYTNLINKGGMGWRKGGVNLTLPIIDLMEGLSKDKDEDKWGGANYISRQKSSTHWNGVFSDGQRVKEFSLPALKGERGKSPVRLRSRGFRYSHLLRVPYTGQPRPAAPRPPIRRSCPWGNEMKNGKTDSNLIKKERILREQLFLWTFINLRICSNLRSTHRSEDFTAS